MAAMEWKWRGQGMHGGSPHVIISLHLPVSAGGRLLEAGGVGVDWARGVGVSRRAGLLAS